MKLNHLRVKNFKKLKSFSVDFSSGQTVVMGENAKGKSTVLQAIVVALYGTSAVAGDKKDLVTWGEKNFSIDLGLHVDGEDLVIARDLRNAKVTDAKGVVKASGNSVCVKFITELLGMTAKDFALFVYSEQGDTTGVLTYGVTALQKRVEEFSGAEVIDQVLVKVRSNKTAMERELARIEWVPVEEDIAHLEKMKEAFKLCESRLAILTEQYNKNSDSLNLLTAEYEEKLKAYHEVQNRQASLENLKVAEQGLAAKIVTLKQGVQPLKDLESLESRHRKVTKDLEDLTAAFNRRNELYSAICEAEKRLETLETLAHKETEAKEKLPEVKNAVEEIENSLTALLAELNAAEVKSSNLASELDNKVCSSCGRPIEDFDPESHKVELQSAKDKVQRLTQKVNAQRSHLGDAKAELLSLLGSISNHCEDLHKAAGALVRTKEEYSGLPVIETSEIEGLREVRVRLKDELTGASNHNQNITNLQNLIDSEEVGLSGLRAQIEKISKDLTEIGSVNKPDFQEISKLNETLQGLKNDLDVERTKHTSLRLDINVKGAAIEAEVAKKNHAAELSSVIKSHQDLEKYLSGSRASYMQRVWDQILGVASSKLSQATKGLDDPITRVGRSESGTFVAEVANKWTPFANLSGAQKGFVGVSLRIGLALALKGGTPLLMLDEPSESMSDSNAQRLSAMLMGLSGQCVLVTHRVLEQITAQSVIEVGA